MGVSKLSKSDAIRVVVSELGDVAAGEIAAEIRRRFGIAVSAGAVRAVRSRDRKEGYGLGGQQAVPALVRRRVLQVDGDEHEPSVRAGDDLRHDDRDGDGDGDGDGDREGGDLLDSDEQLLDLIGRVSDAIGKATAGKPQQISGNSVLIGTISEILDDPEVRGDNEPYEYAVSDGPRGLKTLKLFAAGVVPVPLPEPMPEPEPEPVVKYRPPRSRKRREPACAFCGRAKGFSTPQLYLVHGGALGPRQQLLCLLHTMGETAAGAIAVPYAEEPRGQGITQVVTPAVR